MRRCTSSGLSTTGKRCRSFGHGRSSRTSRRLNTYRQKNRSAQIWRDHRPDRKSSFLEQKQVVAAELGGGESVEARAGVLAKRLNDLERRIVTRRSRDAPTAVRFQGSTPQARVNPRDFSGYASGHASHPTVPSARSRAKWVSKLAIAAGSTKLHAEQARRAGRLRSISGRP